LKSRNDDAVASALFDVSVVTERGVVAEQCLDLTLRFVAEDWPTSVIVEKNAAGRRHERAACERRMIKPGAV